MRFIMLSLEHVHPFHFLTELSKSSIGIHIRPVINKSYRDQLGVLWNSKPGSGGNKTVTHEEQEKSLEKINEHSGMWNVLICVCMCLHLYVPDVHIEGFRLCVILEATVDVNDNLL